MMVYVSIFGKLVFIFKFFLYSHSFGLCDIAFGAVVGLVKIDRLQFVIFSANYSCEMCFGQLM